MGPSFSFRIAFLAALLAPRLVAAIGIEGDLTYTSDYILRGISETAGRSAGQIDVHLMTQDGSFAGVFATTLGKTWQVGHDNLGWDYALDEYIGYRFDLNQSWSTTVTATNYSYLKGNAPFSNDYQELSVAASYLDFATVTVAYIPNSVSYFWGYRLGRYPAYSADIATQLPLVGRLLLTTGVGYYTTENAGYAFGNAGLAYEFKSLRLEAGWFVAQPRAQSNFPYGRAGNRFAGSVSWHFNPPL